MRALELRSGRAHDGAMRLCHVVLMWCLLLLQTGCGGPTAPESHGGGAVLTEPRPDLMRTSGWLQFADLSLHTVADAKPPKEPFVRGSILGGRFFPTGPVEGVVREAPPKRVLTKGSLHLETRAFKALDSEGPIRTPFVFGWKDTESGAFFPATDVQTDPTAQFPAL